MSHQATRLLDTHKTPLGVAEALLEGRLSRFEQQFIGEVVMQLIFDAARIRIEHRREDERLRLVGV